MKMTVASSENESIHLKKLKGKLLRKLQLEVKNIYFISVLKNVLFQS